MGVTASYWVNQQRHKPQRVQQCEKPILISVDPILLKHRTEKVDPSLQDYLNIPYLRFDTTLALTTGKTLFVYFSTLRHLA